MRVSNLGCEVIGPAPNMAAARELLDGEEFDAALLDIHIRGERVSRSATCSPTEACRSC
jgi:hypothetical protein